MAISKVIYKESANATPVTWMDATSATAAAADITAPKTAMLADGEMTTGTGRSGNETGSFIGSGNANITISVSALYNNIHIWLEDVRSDDTVSSEYFAKYEAIEYYADNTTGFYSVTAVNNGQTAFDGRTGGIGRWGGNTGWNNRVEFTASTIKIINANYAGAGVSFNGNKTYLWEAW